MSKKIRVIIGSFLVLAFLAVFVAWPYLQLLTADDALQKGSLLEALEMYEQLDENLFFGDRALEGIQTVTKLRAEEALEAGDFDTVLSLSSQLIDTRAANKLRRTVADRHMEAGAYRQAAELYDKLNEDDLEKNAWRAYGDESLKAGQYTTAVEAYERIGDPEATRNAQILFADDLHERGLYTDAEFLYKELQMPEKAKASALCYGQELISNGQEENAVTHISAYTGNDVAEMACQAATAYAARSGEAAEVSAQRMGSNLRHLETQIAFCNLLRNEGLDLSVVYPEGVAVDVDLAAYSFANKGDSEETPDWSKMLIFHRVDEMPELRSHTNYSMTEIENHMEALSDRANPLGVKSTVFYRPDLMEMMSEDLRAASMDECTSIILFEKGYHTSVHITMRTSRRSSYYAVNSTSSYTVYPSYLAYEALTLIDKADPSMALIYEGYAERPLVYNAIIGDRYADAQIDITPEQIAEIQEVSDNGDEAAKAELIEKYGQEIIDFVSRTGWGTYMFIPDPDTNGNIVGTDDNVHTWFVPKYMIAKHTQDMWMQSMIDDKAIAKLLLYLYMAQ